LVCTGGQKSNTNWAYDRAQVYNPEGRWHKQGQFKSQFELTGSSAAPRETIGGRKCARQRRGPSRSFVAKNGFSQQKRRRREKVQPRTRKTRDQRQRRCKEEVETGETQSGKKKKKKADHRALGTEKGKEDASASNDMRVHAGRGKQRPKMNMQKT